MMINFGHILCNFVSQQGEGDANDFWRVVVTNGAGEDNRIQTVKTVFRLIHVNTGCALTETDKTLPKW